MSGGKLKLFSFRLLDEMIEVTLDQVNKVFALTKDTYYAKTLSKKLEDRMNPLWQANVAHVIKRPACSLSFTWLPEEDDVRCIGFSLTRVDDSNTITREEDLEEHVQVIVRLPSVDSAFDLRESIQCHMLSLKY